MIEIKNIIVTGANRGIGLGIVKSLAKNQQNYIIMACRDIKKGQQAKNLIKQCQNPQRILVMQLDVSSSQSIDKFIGKLKQINMTMKVDVLVNNAGVAANKDEFGSEIVDWTFKTNFYGTIEFTQKMIPMLIDYGKIVTIGSSAGRSAFKNMNKQLQNKFRNQNLQKKQLFDLMNQFKEAVKEDQYVQKGWPKSIYGMSKLGINLYTKILSKNKEIKNKGLQIYCCCPGYVKTDMTKQNGTRSIQEGIKTPCFLINLPCKIEKDMQGAFFQDEKISSTF